MSNETLEYALKVRDILADEDNWTQVVIARDSNNQKCKPQSPEAVKFCLFGAIRKAYGNEYYPGTSLYYALRQKISEQTLASWNDKKERKHSDVLALLDEIIKEEQLK